MHNGSCWKMIGLMLLCTNLMGFKYMGQQCNYHIPQDHPSIITITDISYMLHYSKEWTDELNSTMSLIHQIIKLVGVQNTYWGIITIAHP